MAMAADEAGSQQNPETFPFPNLEANAKVDAGKLHSTQSAPPNNEWLNLSIRSLRRRKGKSKRKEKREHRLIVAPRPTIYFAYPLIQGWTYLSNRAPFTPCTSSFCDCFPDRYSCLFPFIDRFSIFLRHHCEDVQYIQPLPPPRALARGDPHTHDLPASPTHPHHLPSSLSLSRSLTNEVCVRSDHTHYHRQRHYLQHTHTNIPPLFLFFPHNLLPSYFPTFLRRRNHKVYKLLTHLPAYSLLPSCDFPIILGILCLTGVPE